jgi:putative Holliday junction resolvase
MRYLAIDLGEKRTGLALGDDETGLVSPAGMLNQPLGPAMIAALQRTIEQTGPGAVVVGLPLNMDGTEGPKAKAARAFGDALARQTGMPVHYQDERLSSFAAEQRMAQSGRTHKQKKQLRDALAAAEVLRDFLEQRKGNV